MFKTISAHESGRLTIPFCRLITILIIFGLSFQNRWHQVDIKHINLIMNNTNIPKETLKSASQFVCCCCCCCYCCWFQRVMLKEIVLEAIQITTSEKHEYADICNGNLAVFLFVIFISFVQLKFWLNGGATGIQGWRKTLGIILQRAWICTPNTMELSPKLVEIPLTKCNIKSQLARRNIVWWC